MIRLLGRKVPTWCAYFQLLRAYPEKFTKIVSYRFSFRLV